MSRSSFRQEVPQIVRLAVPVVGASLGLMMLGAVDAIMVGHHSKEALAAVSLGHIYTFAFMIFGGGVLMALDPLMGQAVGARDQETLAVWFHRGLVTALVLAVFSLIPCIWAGDVLRYLGQPEEVIPDAEAYIEIVSIGIPGYMIFVAIRQSLQSLSIVRPIVVTVLIANLLNVALNYALVYGNFGCPALGASGAAWASTVCRWTMVIGTIVFGRRHFARLWRRPTRRVLRLRGYREIFTVGLPSGLQVILEVWLFMATSLLIGRIGTLELAGHQIAMNLAALAFMAPLGIGGAAATRVGYAIGRGDAAGAFQSARAALLLGTGIMVLSALTFALFPEALSRIYTSDSDVIAISCTLLPIAAIFQLFDGAQAVSCGILRGAAQTRTAAVVNFVGYWLLALPLCILMGFRFGFGPRGVWWGLTAGLGFVAIVLVLLIHRRFSLTHLPRQVHGRTESAEADPT